MQMIVSCWHVRQVLDVAPAFVNRVVNLLRKG